MDAYINNDNKKSGEKELHIAPMLDVTNREFRKLMRILSKRCVLWTEMVVDETILHTQDLDFHLKHDDDSPPIVCQIGGNNPETIGPATSVILNDYCYSRIDINMDCPSNRVAGQRKFGAILMKHIEVAESVVRAMHQRIETTSIENDGNDGNDQRKQAQAQPQQPQISVKCRIGVDEEDSLPYIVDFIDRLSKQGCRIFHLHARKCVLGGLLTPAQNRAIPPLNYPRIYELCHLFPHLTFYINAGIPDLQTAHELCFGGGGGGGGGAIDSQPQHGQPQHQVPCPICDFTNGSCIAAPKQVPPNLKGCLIGRMARDNPCMLWDVDRYFYGAKTNPCQNRRQVLDEYCLFLEQIYPRRCCDNDSRITSKLEHPKGLELRYNACRYCHEFGCNPPLEHYDADTSTASLAPDEEEDPTTTIPLKITVHVMYRSVAPLWGLFFGVPKLSKSWKRECDRLVQKCPEIRNCGPANLIRRALRNVVPDEVLDQPFVPTEELSGIKSSKAFIKGIIQNACQDCRTKPQGRAKYY